MAKRIRYEIVDRLIESKAVGGHTLDGDVLVGRLTLAGRHSASCRFAIIRKQIRNRHVFRRKGVAPDSSRTDARRSPISRSSRRASARRLRPAPPVGRRTGLSSFIPRVSSRASTDVSGVINSCDTSATSCRRSRSDVSRSLVRPRQLRRHLVEHTGELGDLVRALRRSPGARSPSRRRAAAPCRPRSRARIGLTTSSARARLPTNRRPVPARPSCRHTARTSSGA